jgi:hypothetical protein
MAKEQSIPHDKLGLNLDNPRYPEKKVSERDALVAIVDADTINLALDILDAKSLNPLSRIGVFKQEGIYVPAEGNRRIAAIKLLTNPALVDSLTQIPEGERKKLRAADSKVRSTLKTIPCVVFEKEADAARWVRLTHTGKNNGAGVVSWEREQSLRYDAKFGGKTPIQIQLMDYMRSAFTNEPEIKTRLDSKELALTALERVIKDPDMRDFIGVKWEDSRLVSTVAPEEVAKPLRKIVRDLTHTDPAKRQNTRTLSRKDDIRKYRETFEAKDRSNHKRETTKWALDKSAPSAFLRAQASTSTRSRPSTDSRKFLIPSTTTLAIKPQRINDMYRELKSHLAVEHTANATAVLVRVFLEASINHYLVNYCGKKWTDIGDRSYTLEKRATDCFDALVSANKIDGPAAKTVSKEINNPHSPMHPQSLNAAVHNASSNPRPGDLKRSWNNIEPLFIAIWG